jgi:hypothetical protein
MTDRTTTVAATIRELLKGFMGILLDRLISVFALRP